MGCAGGYMTVHAPNTVGPLHAHVSGQLSHNCVTRRSTRPLLLALTALGSPPPALCSQRGLKTPPHTHTHWHTHKCMFIHPLRAGLLTAGVKSGMQFGKCNGVILPRFRDRASCVLPCLHSVRRGAAQCGVWGGRVHAAGAWGVGVWVHGQAKRRVELLLCWRGEFTSSCPQRWRRASRSG